LLLDALGLGKVSVGPPYFDSVIVPLMVPVAFLLGVGPLARWKQAELPALARRLRWAAGVSVVAALATGWLAGRIALASTVGLWMSFWIAASIATDLHDRLRPLDRAVLARLRALPRPMLGMLLAHLGVAVFAFGVSMVASYSTERDVKMAIGESTQVAGQVFTLRSVQRAAGPNFDAQRALLVVTREGKTVAELRPEKRVYRAQGTTMNAAAIDRSLTRDLYVSLGEPLADGSWIVRVYCKPFVAWIWGGCLTMALGGALAASDRRYRAKQKRSALQLDAALHGASPAGASV
jgi:cytochrome c-type biogenesis protein CcmF